MASITCLIPILSPSTASTPTACRVWGYEAIPPSRPASGRSLLAGGQGLRHQLAQRLEQGEADAENPLLARYQVFLAAEGRLTVPTDPDLASLQQLFDQREQLRQQSFTPAEQDQLFAEDRLMEQWTLRRKALAQASDADKKMLAGELELWLTEQPQWFREAEVNSRLLGELQTLAQLPPAEREAVLLEQLGPEAVDRLHQLEQSQQGFEQQLQRSTAACSASCRRWRNYPLPNGKPCCWSSWDQRPWIDCISWNRVSKGSSSSWQAIWPSSPLCPPLIGPSSNRRYWRAGFPPSSGGGSRH
nr:lipase chaperone [Aeromonas salmonicida]